MFLYWVWVRAVSWVSVDFGEFFFKLLSVFLFERHQIVFFLGPLVKVTCAAREKIVNQRYTLT